MTHPSTTRIALTSAAALAAVGIASLALTFARADADADDPPPPETTTSTTAPSTTVALTTTATLAPTTEAPVTTLGTTTTTAPPCLDALYLVIELAEEPDTTLQTVPDPDAGSSRGTDACLRFDQHLDAIGATVIGAFLSAEDACRLADSAKKGELWAAIPAPTTTTTTEPAGPGYGGSTDSSSGDGAQLVTIDCESKEN